MLRKQAAAHKQTSDHITWRGHEITRIEAFSDAVFAFGVTLLIMSLEVPHDYNELMHELSFMLPFGICFGITMMIWYQQNIFFRRFGMHDMTTIILNGMLLFSVLVYMFPLKFLIGGAFTKDFHIQTQQQAVNIFVLYSVGFACFNSLFALMYLNAYAKRERLELSKAEVFATLTTLYINLSIAAVSLISVAIAMVWGPAGGIALGYAGMAYALIGPAVMILTGKRDKIYKQRFGNDDALAMAQKIDKSVAKELSEVPDDEVN